MIDRIYLGDRTVKDITLSGWDKIVRIKIDCISRLKRGTEKWGFYDEEDLEDGYLVFSSVSNFQIIPPGAIPDDYIVDYSFEKTDSNESIFKIISGGMVPDRPGNRGECHIIIKYQESWLENSLAEKIDDTVN